MTLMPITTGGNTIVVCVACGCPPNLPSPMDALSARAWSPSPFRTGAPICKWCAILFDIFGQDRWPDIPCDSFLWALRSMFSLMLEGRQLHSIGQDIIITRQRMLEELFNGIGSMEVAMGNLNVARARAPTHLPFAPRTPPLRPDMVPLQVRTPPMLPQENPEANAPSHTTESMPTTSPRNPGLAASTPPSAQASSASFSRDTPGAASARGVGIEHQAFADAGDLSREPTVLSFRNKFPSSPLGTSLTRMRRSVNDYLVRTSEPFWYETLVEGTLKALERRLGNHSMSVQETMNSEVITAYYDLRNRITAIITMWKAIYSWYTTHSDAWCATVLKMRDRLMPAARALNMDWAYDLKVVFMMCEFWVSMSRKTDVLQVVNWGCPISVGRGVRGAADPYPMPRCPTFFGRNSACVRHILGPLES